MSGLVLIRADGNPFIGAGHIMRCSAIASEIQQLGADVMFLVSDEKSENLVKMQGFDCMVLGGNADQLNAIDGELLASFAINNNAKAVLIDSYAVTSDFFDSLAYSLKAHCVNKVYLDDAYTYKKGIAYTPVVWPVDTVVNYTFGFSEDDYSSIYGDATRCAIGPQFAPLRVEFSGIPRMNPSNKCHILITTGSTNPKCSLERLVSAVMNYDTDIYLDVIVGQQASYDGPVGKRIEIHHDVKDMASLMRSSTFAISAAGSTLYELCATGTPTIALPMFENQIRNVNGFLDLNLGVGIRNMRWKEKDMLNLVDKLKIDKDLRKSLSVVAQSSVDGRGAFRIAELLCN